MFQHLISVIVQTNLPVKLKTLQKTNHYTWYYSLLDIHRKFQLKFTCIIHGDNNKYSRHVHSHDDFVLRWTLIFLELVVVTHVTINKIITSRYNEAESSHALSYFSNLVFCNICIVILLTITMEPTLCLYRMVIRLSRVIILSYDKTDRTLFEDWQESEWMNERSTALHEIWVFFLFRQAH